MWVLGWVGSSPSKHSCDDIISSSLRFSFPASQVRFRSWAEEAGWSRTWVIKDISWPWQKLSCWQDQLFSLAWSAWTAQGWEPLRCLCMFSCLKPILIFRAAVCGGQMELALWAQWFSGGLNTGILVIRCDTIAPPPNTILLPILMTSLNGATTSLNVWLTVTYRPLIPFNCKEADLK